ncbi:hypothetical protein [Streptomyces sp. NPDC004629]|uniref:hypothetical protein n=1 Tax=Streptomyces sp. NPDC004629 TaxID=3364705 RepID=UPI0036BDAD82
MAPAHRAATHRRLRTAPTRLIAQFPAPLRGARLGVRRVPEALADPPLPERVIADLVGNAARSTPPVKKALVTAGARWGGTGGCFSRGRGEHSASRLVCDADRQPGRPRLPAQQQAVRHRPARALVQAEPQRTAGRFPPVDTRAGNGTTKSSAARPSDSPARHRRP